MQDLNITTIMDEMNLSKPRFDWFEYIVFVLMLGISTLIGVFFCCYHGGQKTVNEYLLGNKQMQIFPIAMSLIASSISGVTLLGVPTEIYRFGAQFALAFFANCGVALGTLYFFLPVFYKLQIISLYEYLEMRFNHWVRKFASILFTIAWTMFMPIVIYGPAIAFNQVSDLSIHIVSPIVCAVCIFYTTFGGLKAVVWADALQGAVMLGSISVVCVMGVIRVGGISEVFNRAEQGDRLNFNLDPDPTVRLSVWSATFGLTLQWIAYTATSPAAIQRFVALPTYAQAKRSVIFLLVGTCTFLLLSVFMGLVIYAQYYDCDPKSVNAILKLDQLLPHFVLDVAGHIRGLPGLFVAGIVCAALSTMSTGLNTLSGTIYEDFIEPWAGKKSEKEASNIMKLISVVIGIVCVALVPVVERMGEGIIEMTSKFSGVTSGATLGIFTLGVFVPQANSAGALIGGLSSLIIMCSVMIAREYMHVTYIPLPCGHTCSKMTNFSLSDCANDTLVNSMPPGTTESDSLFIFRITVFYYGAIGLMIVLIVGIAVSWLTGFNDPATVNPDLITPLARRFLPRPSKYTAVPLKEGNKEKKDLSNDVEINNLKNSDKSSMIIEKS